MALALLTGCTLGSHAGGSATAAPPSASAPPPVGSIEHPRPVECVDGLTFDSGASTPPFATASGPAAPAAAGSPSAGSPTGGSPTGDPSSADSPSADAVSRPGSPLSASAARQPNPTGSSTWTAASTAGGPTASGTPSDRRPAAADVTVGPLAWRSLRALANGVQTSYGIHNSDGWHYRISPDLRPGSVVTVTIGVQQRARAGLEYGGGYGTTPAPAVTFHSCPSATTTFPGGFFVAGDGRACVPLDVRVGDGPPRRVVISFFDGDCSA